MCRGEKLLLYDRLGGTAAVKAIVDEFYTRILADPNLTGFFENTRMALLKGHQVQFMKVGIHGCPRRR